MVKILRRTGSLQKSDQLKVLQRIQQVHNHPAWKGVLTIAEMTDMLMKCDPYVFILAQGKEPSRFYLAFKVLDKVEIHDV